MADVTGDVEQGDIEARFREALEKDRRQAEQLRRNAWAVCRAMEGWQRVRSEEEWVKICEESREEYKSQAGSCWNSWEPSGTWTRS